MTRSTRTLLILFVSVLFASASIPDADEPWKPEEMMSPRELSEKIMLNKLERPVVLNIGPEGLIKTAIRIGPVNFEEGLNNFKTALLKIPKNREVVIYCGCCTVHNCPNIRPAFAYMKEAGYTRARVLNIATNLHVDWVKKGYPIE